MNKKSLYWGIVAIIWWLGLLVTLTVSDSSLGLVIWGFIIGFFGWGARPR